MTAEGAQHVGVLRVAQAVARREHDDFVDDLLCDVEEVILTHELALVGAAFDVELDSLGRGARDGHTCEYGVDNVIVSCCPLDDVGLSGSDALDIGECQCQRAIVEARCRGVQCLDGGAIQRTGGYLFFRQRERQAQRVPVAVLVERAVGKLHGNGFVFALFENIGVISIVCQGYAGAQRLAIDVTSWEHVG